MPQRQMAMHLKYCCLTTRLLRPTGIVCLYSDSILQNYIYFHIAKIYWISVCLILLIFLGKAFSGKTRKPSCRWQTHVTRKHAKNCSNSTCLQRCRWQCWSIFICLAVVASKICEIPRNSLKIQTIQFKVIQGHRSWCQSEGHMLLPISHK